MITRLEFAGRPMRVGEARMVHVSAVAPITISIRCFVEKPPPPGFRACPECGSLRFDVGEVNFEVVASQSAFEDRKGNLSILVRDGEGDEREIRLAVVGKEPDEYYEYASGGGAAER